MKIKIQPKKICDTWQKAVLTWRFMALSAYIRKKNDLKSITGFYLMKLMKEEQFKLKAKRGKEIIIKLETMIENRKTIKIINETKRWFF